MDEPLITISYQLTLDEFQEAQRLGPRTRGLLYWFSRMVLAILLLVFVFGIGGGGSQFLSHSIPLLVVTAVWIAAMYSLPRAITAKRFRSRGLQAMATVEIFAEGFHFRNQVPDSRTSWKAFIRYLESSTLFIVYTSNTLFYTFPKRAFSEPDIGRFRELLEQNVRAA